MNNFKLSSRSLENLNGVETDLQKVVHRAIEITDIDFGVIEGLRTLERQEELVEEGLSQTLNSEHLEGRAVDLLAYVGANSSWDLGLYFPIADAMFAAARELHVDLRWGGAWHVPSILMTSNNALNLHIGYLKYKLHQGSKPFIDAVHFELA